MWLVDLCWLVGQSGSFQVQHLQGSAGRHGNRQHPGDLITWEQNRNIDNQNIHNDTLHNLLGSVVCSCVVW